MDLTKVPLVFSVYKPVGKSSFFPVHIFKRNLHYDYGKIGHFGTLDPFAEGLLLVGVQGAQKLNDYIHKEMSKTYEASGFFGAKTKSGDIDTEIIEEKDIDISFQNLKKEEIEDLMIKNFMGEYWQAPHPYSAAKYQGKRLYHLAIDGKFISLDKRKRDILDIEILEYNYPHIKFKIEVTSGTYIRTFFEDLSLFFGGVGHLQKLVRTHIGDISVSSAIKDIDWPKREAPFDIAKYGMRLNQIYPLSEYEISDYSAKMYVNGIKAPLKKTTVKSLHNNGSQNNVWVFCGEDLLGMGIIEGENIKTVFNFPASIIQYS